MDQREFEPAPGDHVHQYGREIRQILEALGDPEAFVTEETRIGDFPLRAADEGPSLTELRIDLGVRVRPDDRLVAQRPPRPGRR
jgi:hypothetical protein